MPLAASLLAFHLTQVSLALPNDASESIPAFTGPFPVNSLTHFPSSLAWKPLTLRKSILQKTSSLAALPQIGSPPLDIAQTRITIFLQNVII